MLSVWIHVGQTWCMLYSIVLTMWRTIWPRIPWLQYLNGEELTNYGRHILPTRRLANMALAKGRHVNELATPCRYQQLSAKSNWWLIITYRQVQLCLFIWLCIIVLYLCFKGIKSAVWLPDTSSLALPTIADIGKALPIRLRASPNLPMFWTKATN